MQAVKGSNWNGSSSNSSRWKGSKRAGQNWKGSWWSVLLNKEERIIHIYDSQMAKEPKPNSILLHKQEACRIHLPGEKPQINKLKVQVRFFLAYPSEKVTSIKDLSESKPTLSSVGFTLYLTFAACLWSSLCSRWVSTLGKVGLMWSEHQTKQKQREERCVQLNIPSAARHVRCTAKVRVHNGLKRFCADS